MRRGSHQPKSPKDPQQILCVSYRDRVTNEEVRRTATRPLYDSVIERRVCFGGHILRQLQNNDKMLQVQTV